MLIALFFVIVMTGALKLLARVGRTFCFWPSRTWWKCTRSLDLRLKQDVSEACMGGSVCG